MPFLCGAWVLDGGPIAGKLSEPQRRAMLAQLPPAAGAPAELLRGPLWLSCGASAYADADHGLLTLRGGPAPGQDIYFTHVGGLLLFSSSLRALLAHPDVPRRADPDTFLESALAGGVLFGTQTLAAGIEAVPPGVALSWEPGSRTPRRSRDLPGEAVARPGDPPSSAAIAAGLRESVRLALGEDRQASVLVSGGTDSAAVLGLTVERLGAANVRAFTYELAGGPPSQETELSRRTCAHFGVEQEVVPITCHEFLEAVPEFLWRLEDYTPIRHGLCLYLLARRATRRGPPKVLSGLGMDTLFGEPRLRGLDGLGRALERPPGPVACAQLADCCPTMRHLILCVLHNNGSIRDLGEFYPPELRERVKALVESARVRGAVREHSRLPLPVQLQLPALRFICNFYSGHRLGKALLQAGIRHEMPALILASLLPLPYAIGRSEQGLQMEKSAFMKTLRGLLPEDISGRPKVSRKGLFDAWHDELRGALEPAALASLRSQDPDLFRLHDCDFFRGGGANSRFQLFLAPTALWHRTFIESPPSPLPPTWESWKNEA